MSLLTIYLFSTIELNIWPEKNLPRIIKCNVNCNSTFHSGGGNKQGNTGLTNIKKYSTHRLH